jgi:hypothetical protein
VPRQNVVRWECPEGHQHKKKRQAEGCARQAERRLRNEVVAASEGSVTLTREQIWRLRNPVMDETKYIAPEAIEEEGHEGIKGDRQTG